MRRLATEYGEKIVLQEYELVKEGHLKGTSTRKVKVYKSVMTDPETGMVVKEFDSPASIYYEFDNAREAGKKAKQLMAQRVLFAVEYVGDGRSGGNARSQLSPELMVEFLKGYDAG